MPPIRSLASATLAGRIRRIARRHPWPAGLLGFVLFATAALAAGNTLFPGGYTYNQSQIEGFFRNSSNPYLRDNAADFAAMSYQVENTRGYTGLNNGANGNGCCTGLMQLHNDNLANPRICGCTAEQFATYDGQRQIDVYTRYFNGAQNDSSIKKLQEMQRNGQTLGGQPVDGATIVACAQLGSKNCRTAIATDCNGGRDGNKSSICDMAAKSRKGGNKNNPNNNNQGGCTTPTEPKEASKPGNIGAGDGSGNPAPAAASGGSAAQGTSGSGAAGGSGGAGTPETPSKSVPCKQAESKATDKSSKTCQPTMKMINELQCSNFPSNIQSFCQQYKPKLMTSDECNRAEKMAEKEKKGERQTECENQTFAQPGTSAWSYVLACSFTQKNQGTFGSATQASDGKTGSSGGGGGSTSGDGTPDDPQCVERLKKRIPDLKVLGGVTISANGTTCGMKSGVSSTGIPGVTISPAVTVECLEMEKLADFAEQMKGKGVTRMTNIGSLDRTCRWIRNASGTHVGKVSSHAYGMAVDLSGFYLGGQYFDTKRYWSDSSTKAWMDANVRPLACQIFKGVLGPYFYRGAYSHFHVEMRQKTSCDRGR